MEDYGDTKPGVPRWVVLTGIVAAVGLLVVIAVMLVGGGGHTPRRHGPPGDVPAPAGSAAPHVPPTGRHG